MQHILLIFLLGLLVGSGGVFGYQQTLDIDEINYQVDPNDVLNPATILDNNAISQILTENEIAGLLYMREEEKLARDVYRTLYERWGTRIFNNIAESEQTHMDAVLAVMNKYGVEDIAREANGAFTNQELQTLYDELVARGLSSRNEAFQVGALIEDLDIADLDTYLNQTTNSDMRVVYENLQRGSRNHLRAFNRQVVASTGENYQPTYISQSDFATIITSDTERGGGRGRNR